MEIIEVTSSEYQSLLGANCYVFVTEPFIELNRRKTDTIHYLLGRDSKNRIALAIGEKDSIWKAPFSAPFSDFVFLQSETTIETVWDFVSSLKSFIKEKNGERISIYLPADVYCAKENTLKLSALLGNGFNLDYLDINYHFDLRNIDLETYREFIHRNARKNLRISFESGLELIHCQTSEQKQIAYNVIKANREAKGYPLRMTCEDLMSTIQCVGHDFFLVMKQSDVIASAVIYDINKEIAQVVYWGDVPGYSDSKPINYISYRLIEFFKSRNYRILDVGISTEEGMPNYGLCCFKTSIGCLTSNKYHLSYDFL